MAKRKSSATSATLAKGDKFARMGKAQSAEEVATKRGAGDELHQTASDGAQQLTTNHGIPISDNQNSLKSGDRGPTLLEDMLLREKDSSFRS